MKLTHIKIDLIKSNKTKAWVRIELDECLVINNIKIIKGQFGHFIAFPKMSEASPYKIVDATSTKFRNKLQSEILQEYRKILESQKLELSDFNTEQENV